MAFATTYPHDTIIMSRNEMTSSSSTRAAATATREEINAREDVKTRQREWELRDTNVISAEQEQVFLTMKRRRLEREWNGRQERRNTRDLIALLILLVILYGAGVASYTIKDDYTITLELGQMIFIGMWILGVTFITFAFGKTKFITILYWMLVYLPLIAIFASVATSPFLQNQHELKRKLLTYGFLIVQILSFWGFLMRTYFYPFIINTKFFRETLGAGKFWGIRVVSEWAMTYEGSFTRCSKRCACKYEGEFNPNGLPHGSGQWIDDSYWGELLSGLWENGKPVAPYISRQYGTGDTFCAVPIAYFIASDDEFEKCHLNPTTDLDPRCGVASVECNIQGAFYNNLPEASKLFGPFTLANPNPNEKNNQYDDNQHQHHSSLAQCLKRLSHLDEAMEEQDKTLTIVSGDPRGVQIEGHIYEPTGLPFSQDADNIVINIERERSFHEDELYLLEKIKKSAYDSNRKANNFLPLASESFFENELLHVLIEEDEKHDDFNLSITDSERRSIINDIMTPTYKPPILSVENWVKDVHKTVLVYFPGFASPLKKSLESLGQLMALTNLSKHVYPIVYQWPCGQHMSYPRVAVASSSDSSKRHFLKFLDSLQEAGIRNIHFMSHSMGAQSLLAMMDDELDGSRSDASLYFRADRDFAMNNNKTAIGPTNTMICKSITLLNPDFPVDAFVDHAFVGIRRICNRITVVGDRNDQALLFSQVLNGVLTNCGYKQPKLLTKRNAENSKGFTRQRTIGRDFGYLFFPNVIMDIDREKNNNSNNNNNDHEKKHNLMLFREAPPVVLSPSEEMQDRQWLDIDVIDSSNIDTNVAQWRHSAFNVNPILLKDLEELIITGRRAINRSTLIHREGNIFSYAHAPSFIVM